MKKINQLISTVILAGIVSGQAVLAQETEETTTAPAATQGSEQGCGAMKDGKASCSQEMKKEMKKEKHAKHAKHKAMKKAKKAKKAEAAAE